MKIRKYYFVIILFSILFIIVIILFKNPPKINIQEDFLFLKWLANNQTIRQSDFYKSNIENQKANKYFFDVDYKNTNLRTISLKDTIDAKTLAEEKIAPGTRGKFEIVIYSSKKSDYQIMFQSKEKKPQNIKFFLTENYKFNTLEELQKLLNGTVEEKIAKTIEIFWEWEYDVGEAEDAQDTNDGKNIDNYTFDILVEAI